MLHDTKDLEVTGISRSGRVRKKSSKLLDFESDDLNESRLKKQKAQQQHQAYQILEKFEQKQKLQAKTLATENYTTLQKKNLQPSQVSYREQQNFDNSTTENEEQTTDSEEESVATAEEEIFNTEETVGSKNSFLVEESMNSEETFHSEEAFNTESLSDDDIDEEDEDDDDDDEEEDIDQLSVKNSNVQLGFQKLEPPQPKTSKSVYMLEKYNRKVVIKDGKVVSSKTKTQRKDKGKSRYTAYMLWAKETRQTLLNRNPNLDFSTIAKRLGELWATVPYNEKYNWKKRAKRLNETQPMQNSTKENLLKLSSDTRKPFINRITVKEFPAANKSVKIETKTSINNISQAKAKPSPSKVTLPSQNESANESFSETGGFKVTGTQPIDVAAHLKLLGESLTIIGERLKEHDGQITISGSIPLLLDSLLCALSPLMCLTQQIPELNGANSETLSNTLENVAYIMPGL